MAQPESEKKIYTIKSNSIVEMIERKSRFIAYAFKVYTEQQALEELAKLKSEFPDATHHTYAYIVKDENILYQRYSDDREPAGTAGLPILEVLKKGSLENVLIVVIRYFGGTLLGTGGLVRSYGKSARLAVEKAGIARRVLCTILVLSVDYSLFERLRRQLEEYEILDILYEENVTVRFAVEHLNKQYEIDKITEASNSRLDIVEQENIYMEI